MKLYKVLCISVIALAVSSCKDADKKEVAADTKASAAAPAPSSTKGTIKFKVNGQLVSTSAWNVSVNTSMTGICLLNVTSNMHEDARTIGININACSVGNYPFSTGLSTINTKGIAYGSYKPDYLKNLMDSWRFESGNFTIESFNEQDMLLNASFSGKVKSKKGEELEITEGKVINAIVKRPPKGALN